MIRVIYAIIASLILDIIPGLVGNTSRAWDIYVLCGRVEVAVWLMVLMSFIPYRKLMTKSLVAVYVVTELFNVPAYLFYQWLDHPYITYSAKFIISLTWVFYICWRDYDRANDKLDEHHFFRVGIRPVEFQDFILSLIREPIGGVGIYVNGEFYHYRKGRLVVHDRRYVEKASGKYRIHKMRPIDNRRLAILRSLAHSRYSAWSWAWNCKTVLEPILGKRGKPLFYRKGAVRGQKG